MSPPLAEHLYDDRKARDCEGEDRADYAPDDLEWEAHIDDFDVLFERCSEGFDFAECEPLPAFVEVVIDRQVAEAEAARCGHSLPWGVPIVKIDTFRLTHDRECYLYEQMEDGDAIWIDPIPPAACLRYPTKTDRRNAVEWDRMGVTR